LLDTTKKRTLSLKERALELLPNLPYLWRYYMGRDGISFAEMEALRRHAREPRKSDAICGGTALVGSTLYNHTYLRNVHKHSLLPDIEGASKVKIYLEFDSRDRKEFMDYQHALNGTKYHKAIQAILEQCKKPIDLEGDDDMALFYIQVKTMVMIATKDAGCDVFK